MYQVSDAGNAFANCAMTITNRPVGRWLVSSQLIWLVLIVQIHDSIITALLMLLLMLVRWLWLEPFAFQKSLPKRFLSNEKKPLWPRNMNAARILTRTPSRTTPCTPTPTCCTRCRRSRMDGWMAEMEGGGVAEKDNLTLANFYCFLSLPLSLSLSLSNQDTSIFFLSFMCVWCRIVNGWFHLRVGTGISHYLSLSLQFAGSCFKILFHFKLSKMSFSESKNRQKEAKR